MRVCFGGVDGDRSTDGRLQRTNTHPPHPNHNTDAGAYGNSNAHRHTAADSHTRGNP